jgi:hypothetical protein
MNKGEIVGKESNAGIVAANWKDKQNVTFISMRHGLEMINMSIQNREKRKKVIKPSASLFYNSHKKGTDVSNQMSSYCTVLR